MFGYHIGDLDPFYFEHCRWAVNRDTNGEIEDVVLISDGLSVPAVLAFGMGSSFESLLKEVLQGGAKCQRQCSRNRIVKRRDQYSSQSVKLI